MGELKRFLILICCLQTFAVGTPLQKGDRSVAELEAQLKAITSRLDDLTRKFDTHIALTEKPYGMSSDVKEIDLAGGSSRSDQLNRVYRSTENDDIAFTAVVFHQSLENIPVGTTIVFDFLTRSTPTFDIQTGVFTCPQSGLYLFSIFIQSAHDKEALVQIMMDGNPYSSAVSEPSTEGEDDTGGNVVLLDVKEGARIWVETVHIDNQSLYRGRTTFSGVLIHRDVTK